MNKPILHQLDFNKYIYIFPDGTRSQTFYFADEFKENMAVVSATEFGGYQYLNMQNQLSETFEQAFEYNDGFAVVQKDCDGGLQFRDKSGKLSEEFATVTGYNKGYATVRLKKNGPLLYRDILGHLSKTKTHLGDLAYEFYNMELNVTELPDACFRDSAFFEMIKLRAYVDACLDAGARAKEKDEFRDDLYLDNLQYVYDRMYNAGIDAGDIKYPTFD